ncbi:MAG: hypothetical protein Q7R70_05950 [Candidatus Diapherotrites archaeon]|nr:hypothetical protein [Candidatus Diapherotrites archaeon]
MASRTEWVLGIVIFAAVFSAILIVFTQANPGPEKFKFEATEGGVVFQSNEKQPSEFLTALKDHNEFVIVISSSSVSEDISARGNTMIMFQSILTANKKKAIALIRNFAKGSLASCNTNYGLAQLNEQIDPKACNELLDSNRAFVFIEASNAELKQPRVFLEKNSIFLKASKDSEMQDAGFLVLKTMYSDSEGIVKLINDFLKNSKSK